MLDGGGCDESGEGERVRAGVGLLFYTGLREGLEEKGACESRPEEGMSVRSSSAMLS